MKVYLICADKWYFHSTLTTHILLYVYGIQGLNFMKRFSEALRFLQILGREWKQPNKIVLRLTLFCFAGLSPPEVIKQKFSVVCRRTWKRVQIFLLFKF